MTSALAREQTFEAFKETLDAFFHDKPREVVQLVHRDLHIQALERVVTKTPVDTGRARGNWQASLHQPAAGETVTRDPGGGETIARGALVAAQIEPYSASFVTNNVPYILMLEEGGYPKPGEKQRATTIFGEIASRTLDTLVSFETKDGKLVQFFARARTPKVTADGYSRQAPRGMAAITVQELAAQFESTLEPDQ